MKLQVACIRHAAVLTLLLLSVTSPCEAHTGPWYPDYNYQRKLPKDVMVDVINNLGISLLQVHNEHNENNIAISPYGATSVLIALVEGLIGDAADEIKYAINLPPELATIRVGLRDIHRHLKSYFIPKEGFLAGLTLSHDNITLNREYESILRFYGYDIESFNNPVYPEQFTTNPPTSTIGTTTTDDTLMTTIKESVTASITVSASTQMVTTKNDADRTTRSDNESTTIIIQTTKEMETTTTDSDEIVTQAETNYPTPNELSTRNEAAITTTEEKSDEVSTQSTGEITETTEKKEDVDDNEVAETEKAVVTEARVEVTEAKVDVSDATTTKDDVTIGTVAEEATDKDAEDAKTEGTSTSSSNDNNETTPAEAITEIKEEPTENSAENEVTSTENVEGSEQKEASENSAEKPDATPTETSADKEQATTEMTEMQKEVTTEEIVSSERIQEETTVVPTENISTEAAEEGVSTEVIDTTVPPEEQEVRTSSEMEIDASIAPPNGDGKRKKRSVVDYLIARYYDNYYVHNNNNRYIPMKEPIHYRPEVPFTFLVNGKYREPNISFMTYDTVLPFYYIPGLDAMALSFPLDSNMYYLLLVLPLDEQGIDKLIYDFKKVTTLKGIVEKLKYTHVRAVIPSFTLKGYVVLTPSLQKLCIRKIFEPRHADFSPLTAEKNVYVTNIEQAVTVTIRNYMDPTSASARNLNTYRPVEFKADHPFLYFVMDSQIHVNLMAGKVINPLNSRIR